MYPILYHPLPPLTSPAPSPPQPHPSAQHPQLNTISPLVNNFHINPTTLHLKLMMKAMGYKALQANNRKTNPRKPLGSCTDKNARVPIQNSHNAPLNMRSDDEFSFTQESLSPAIHSQHSYCPPSPRSSRPPSPHVSPLSASSSPPAATLRLQQRRNSWTTKRPSHDY